MQANKIFWEDWPNVGDDWDTEVGLDEDFARIYEEGQKLIDEACEFLIADMNSPFYEDDVFGAACREKLYKHNINSITKLKTVLEDLYPCAFTASLDEAELMFFEKAVYFAEIIRQNKGKK